MNAEHVLVPDENLLSWDSMPPAVLDELGKYPIPIPGQTELF
jgi:hypothetical protein